MANEIVTHGREWTQVQVQQMMAKAELKAVRVGMGEANHVVGS